MEKEQKKYLDELFKHHRLLTLKQKLIIFSWCFFNKRKLIDLFKHLEMGMLITFAFERAKTLIKAERRKY